MRLSQPLPDVLALDLLVTVAERGSISEAAKRHFITQPAASVRLRTLEQVLGLALLERSPAGSRLTPEGTATVEWARPILDGMRSLIVSTTALRQEGQSRLRVAASLTVAEYLMPTWLQCFVAALPSAVASLQMGNSVAVTELVAAGEAELGFVEGPPPPRRFRSLDICDDDLVVVVTPSHRWARSQSITPEELAGMPLLLREAGSGTRDVLSHSLAEHGLAARPLVELASTTAIKVAACAGSAPAVLSLLAVKDELRSGRLVAVNVKGLELERKIRAIWLTSILSQPARELLAVASAEGAER